MPDCAAAPESIIVDWLTVICHMIFSFLLQFKVDVNNTARKSYFVQRPIVGTSVNCLHSARLLLRRHELYSLLALFASKHVLYGVE